MNSDSNRIFLIPTSFGEGGRRGGGEGGEGGRGRVVGRLYLRLWATNTLQRVISVCIILLGGGKYPVTNSRPCRRFLTYRAGVVWNEQVKKCGNYRVKLVEI